MGIMPAHRNFTCTIIGINQLGDTAEKDMINTHSHFYGLLRELIVSAEACFFAGCIIMLRGR